VNEAMTCVGSQRHSKKRNPTLCLERKAKNYSLVFEIFDPTDK